MQHLVLPQDAHKTQIYNICMTKHSHFPYTSTYSSTRHYSDRKQHLSHPLHKHTIYFNNNNNNNCLKSNIQCIEIRVQWTVHLGSSHMHVHAVTRVHAVTPKLQHSEAKPTIFNNGRYTTNIPIDPT